MEVMSSLLLCALVGLLPLPQTLGIRDAKPLYSYNNTVLLQQNKNNKNNRYSYISKMMLNVNAPPLVEKHKDVYNDPYCNKQCMDCIFRALKKYNINTSSGKHIRSYLPDMNDNELMRNSLERHRDRRAIETTPSTVSTTKTEMKKEKRTRSRKNKSHKSVTVTKYNINGEVYALKVKETNSAVTLDNMDSKPISTCQVFSVKKAYPCDSPEGYLILAASKTKLNKRVDEETSTDATTARSAKSGSSAYRKRHIDNTQIPENVMPSMEDFE